MTGTRHSEEQIIAILKQAEQTHYRWKAKYAHG